MALTYQVLRQFQMARAARILVVGKVLMDDQQVHVGGRESGTARSRQDVGLTRLGFWIR